MPYEIEFERMPVGFIETCILPGDERGAVRSLGIATSADGELLSTWLSGIPTDILDKVASIGPRIEPYSVNNLLAIIRPDKKATVYVNELSFIASMRVSPEKILTHMKAGEAVYEEDIDDVIEVKVEGIEFPPDSGVVLVCSDGWRKGFFFDLLPVRPHDPKRREFSIESLLGGVFSQFRFQHVFELRQADWDTLFRAKWFPFCGLRKETIKLLVSAVRCGRDPDALLTRIREELTARLPILTAVWEKSPVFDSHIKIIRHAVERFTAEDYISCVAILFPRIEGLLRSNHDNIGSNTNPEQKKLCISAIAGLAERHSSMLVPLRFKEYLENVYFSTFDPKSTRNAVSRNSVGHGVASADDFGLKSAIIGILVCHQLYCNFSISD